MNRQRALLAGVVMLALVMLAVSLRELLNPASTPVGRSAAPQHGGSAARRAQPVGTIRADKQNPSGGPTNGAVFGLVLRKHSRTPVAGAHILVGTKIDRMSRKTMSDAEGRYRIEDLPFEQFLIRAEEATGLSHQGRPVELTPANPEVNIDFILPLTHAIRGMVVSEEGDPLEGVKIKALYPGTLALTRGYDLVAYSDSAGGFAIEGLLRTTSAEPGEFKIPGYQLLCLKEGYACYPSRVEIIEGQDPAPVLITMKRLLDLTTFVGRVVLPSGEPRPDVHVELSMSYKEGERSGRCNEKGTTDSEGHFTVSFRPSLKVVDWEEYNLDIIDREFRPVRLRDLSLVPGMTNDLGVIVLETGPTVSGRVVDRDGMPAGGARVFWSLYEGTPSAFERSVLTDAQGRFVAPVFDNSPTTFSTFPPEGWRECLERVPRRVPYPVVRPPAHGIQLKIWEEYHSQDTACKSCDEIFRR